MLTETAQAVSDLPSTSVMNDILVPMLSYYSYFVATLFASATTGLLAFNLRKSKSGYRSFSWLLASVSVWTLGASLQISSAILDAGLAAQVFWSKAQYVGIAFAPALSLLFICSYTGLLRLRALPVLIIPALTVLIAWTNEYHGLLWREAFLRTDALGGRAAHALLDTEYGAWFEWVHTPYSYLLVMLTFGVLFRALITMRRSMTTHFLILTAALALPLVSNVLFLLGYGGNFDPTPVAFAATGLLLTLALYRFELFRQKPVAYRTVFSDLQEAILVLDENYHIIDANPAALHLLEQPLKVLLGNHVEKYLTLPESVWTDVQIRGTRVEEPMNNGYVDLYLQPVEAGGGYILTIRDVTKRQQAEAKLALQLDKLGALVATGDALRKLHSPQAVYQKAFEVVFAKTKADNCQIFLLKEGSLKAVARARSAELEEAREPSLPVTLDEEVTWRVVESKGAVRLRNPRGLASGGPVDYLGVPIHNEAGRVAGVLAATLGHTGEGFDDSDKSFLEAVAQACGGALSRFTRLAEAQSTAKEYRELYTSAQRQARELALLNRVRNAVTRQVNLDEVIHATVEAVNEEFNDTLVSLYLIKSGDQGDRLVLQHQRGYAALPESLATNAGVIGRVVRTGQAILLSEPSSYPGFISTAEDISSEVAVPVFDHGKVVGVLNLETVRGFKLSQADLKLMMSLSEQISIAVGRARLYEEVHKSEQRFRLLAENMSDLICLHDLEGNFTYVSPSSETVLGYTPEALVAQTPQTHIHPEDLEDTFPSVCAAFAAGESLKAFSYRVRHASGEYIWLETFVQRVTDAAGQATHFVSGSRDITERKKMQEQLLEGALLYDALTELPNRVLFADRLDQAIRRSEREAAPFALLFLDLDRFKIVNDSLGHSVGDSLLVETAKRLQGCVRAQDTVARLGGDEFAIILEGIGENRAKEVADCIQSALSQPYMLDGHSVSTSASIGITLGNDFADTPDPEQLLRNADLAMYHAKASGKARHALFDSTMHRRIQDLMQLELDLRRAVEREEFCVVYQPVVDLDTRSFIGFEALVRWHHPERGTIEPSRFIPVAEEMGLIASIDNWVLKEASRQVSEWDKRFGLNKPLTLSVNLSTKNFLLEDLVATIKEALDSSGLHPSQLKLEITESVLMDNIEVSTSLLQELRAHGIGMQIDDFGTGYSSLSYLHALPLDSLKIDRSFVQKLELTDDSAQDSAIIRTIIALAQSLNLDIVAEGIETLPQLELLTSLGCTYGQGYYMAKPLSSREIETLLAGGSALPDVSGVETLDLIPLEASAQPQPG